MARSFDDIRRLPAYALEITFRTSKRFYYRCNCHYVLVFASSAAGSIVGKMALKVKSCHLMAVRMEAPHNSSVLCRIIMRNHFDTFRQHCAGLLTVNGETKGLKG